MFRFFTFATIAILLYVPVLLLAQEKNALPQSVHFPIDKSFVIYDYPENESMGHRTKRILRIERKEYQTY